MSGGGYARYARHARYGVLALAVALAGSCGGQRAGQPRVLVLGFDGFDHGLARELMAQGKLSNFSRVAAQGSLSALGTAIPPQSPVAWSTFMTGLDPGAHGIFDFVHRDSATMRPYLSTTRTENAPRTMTLGGWRLPLSSARIESLRKGQPFWAALSAHGIDSTIVRMPADFPPSGTATRELSGMGTPDILGTYGQFTYFTSSHAFSETAGGSGAIHKVAAGQDVIRGFLEGPDQPYRAQQEKTSVALTVYVDATRQYAQIVAGGESRLLRVGEWSDWVPLEFGVRPWQGLKAQCRFYLKQLEPDFALYVSPMNLDAMAPALPISTPGSYSADLAEATGRFYTQGMPEDTAALKAGVLSVEEFLEQARLVQRETRRQFDHALSTFDQGLLFYYFGNVDQVSHMLWRARDPGHPAYDAVRDSRYASVIEDLYIQFDGIVGEALAHLRPEDLLVVMSDHGFTSWRRAFNLNAWLRDEGYVVASEGSGGPALGQVDLSKSRAYGLGLNGLYLNLKGREISGIVDPGARDALLQDLTAKLLGVVDPATGQRAIARVFRSDQVYSASGNQAVQPDLIIGYARGTRVSDESAIGEIGATVFSDNASAWSGDHCMDPSAVPGILLTNRALKTSVPTLQALAPAILAELGIVFPGR